MHHLYGENETTHINPLYYSARVAIVNDQCLLVISDPLFPNFQNCMCCEKDLKDNKGNTV